MGESQLETRTDRVRGSGTDREAGSEREGPNVGEGEGHGRRRLGPFFLCVSEHGVILTWRRTRGSLNSVREEARESQRLKKPDRQKETKKPSERHGWDEAAEDLTLLQLQVTRRNSQKNQ